MNCRRHIKPSNMSSECKAAQNSHHHQFPPPPLLATPLQAGQRRPREDEDDNISTGSACSSDSRLEDFENLDPVIDEPSEREEIYRASAQIPSELQDNTVTSQEMDAYMATNRAGPRRNTTFSGRLDLNEKIDKIDPRLVAKFKIGELMRRMKANSLNQKNFERAMNIFKCLASRGEIFANDVEIAVAREKKHIFAMPRPIQPMVSTALRYLMVHSRFLKGTNKPETVLGVRPVTHCGAFFIEKSNKKLRVILDGRHANAYFKPEASSFQFFSVESLRSVIANLSKHKKWYALNYDLRHWFHQIPCPRTYLPYLGMKLTDRKGNARQPFWVFPRSLPMGFIQAPFLAQCCAWGIVLSQASELKWDGSDLSKRFLRRHENNGGPLKWVPLEHGGGIFVFLDNILVVTPEEEVATWWRDKLIRDCHDLHAWLKGSDESGHDMSAPVEEQKRTLDDCFVTLTDYDGSFNFLGVKWTHHKRSVILKGDEDTRTTLPGRMKSSKSGWRGTRRNMAAILGKLLWFRRIHGITYFDADSNETTNAILSIYRKLSPAPKSGVSCPVEGQTVVARWNEQFADVSKKEIDALEKEWVKRATGYESVAKAQPRIARDKPELVVFASTDAATADDLSKAGLAGGCWYTPNPECLDRAPGYNAYPRMETERVVVQSFEAADGIAFGEMFAIKITVEAALKEERKVCPNVIVLATDNLSCKYWIEKGHARNPRIQELLREIHTTLRAHDCRLFVTYVNTKENYSDDISRRRGFDAKKFRETHDVLCRAGDEAIASLWEIDGDVVGGAKHLVK